MRKKTGKKFASSQAPDSGFRKKEESRSRGEEARKSFGQKKFPPPRTGYKKPFGKSGFQKHTAPGAFQSGSKKRFEQKRTEGQKPQPVYSTGGKKRFFRGDEPRPFLKKKSFLPDEPRRERPVRFSEKKNFNSAFPRKEEPRPFYGKKNFQPSRAEKNSFQNRHRGKPETKNRRLQPDHFKLTEPFRLNKYLAHAGIASRRESDELIKNGFVTVNGHVVTEMGHKVQPGDVVKFKNRVISPEKKVYILLNKPKDYITTVSDERGRPTVMDLIHNATEMRIYPVGRLDRNTTGLLLLTNDGELAQKLTHPSFEAKKVYQATIDKPLKKEDMKHIADGVQLEEGKALVDAIEYADPHDKRKIGIELHIGWNKVVRRIFEQLGYKVIQLDRVYYAGLTKDVPRGKWRPLAPQEVIMLKHFA